MDKADRLQHVGNVIQSANLSLEQLLVEHFAVRNLFGGLLETEHILPSHKQFDELLAKVAQRLDFLVLGLLFLRPACRSTALGTGPRRLHDRSGGGSVVVLLVFVVFSVGGLQATLCISVHL